jgi:hypothetical protein
MGNIHALNPFLAAVCSSSGSVMSQPTEDSDDVHAVLTKGSTKTNTTAEESLSPQSFIDNDTPSPFTPVAPSTFKELHISPNSLIEFSAAHDQIENDGILLEDFVNNPNIYRLVVRCIYFLYGKRYKATEKRQDRIDAIKKCVDVDSGCLDRLLRGKR